MYIEINGITSYRIAYKENIDIFVQTQYTAQPCLYI